jgi:uncharacterized protein YhaN
MRIETLGLRAYGPFTDVSIDLVAGEFGLHVIFGSNEAGKSSALRALDAALFGVKGQTNDNFLHEYSALRVAVKLLNDDGGILGVVRRKAVKNSLWNEDESDPLPESAMRPFIGGLNSEEFQRVFGLDHDRLRDGSTRLLDVAEGVGTAIVGAALGLNDLRVVQKDIKNEGSDLFSPRGSKPAINAAIVVWRGLNKDLREHSLSANAWTTARRDAERSAKKRTRAETHEKELSARLADLEFVRRNRRRIVQLDDLRKKLMDLSDAPDLDDGFERRKEHAREELSRAAPLLEEYGEEEQEFQENVDSLKRDFRILEHENEVVELRDRSIETRKGLKDRERRAATADASEEERDRLAGTLGLPTPLDPAAIADLRIASGSQERCEDLLTEYTRLTTSRKEAGGRLITLRLSLEELDDEGTGEDDSIDPGPLARAISDALKLGDSDTVISELRVELEELNRQFDDGVQCLSGFSGDAENLERLPVPGPESLTDFRDRFQTLAGEEAKARHELDDRRKREIEIDGAIMEISSLGAVPSLEDLAEVRTRRDAQWQLVRRSWLKGADVDAEAEKLDSDGPLAESFERSIRESDATADEMRDESERVAKLSEAHLGLDQVAKRNQAAEVEASERNHRQEQLNAEWHAAWDGSGFEVGDTAAMKDTLTDRARLIEELGARRKVTKKIEGLEERISVARSSLLSAMADTGAVISDDTRHELLSPLLQLADERKKALAGGAEERRNAEKEKKRLRSDIGEAERNEKALSEELSEWRKAFDAATRGLPMPKTDPPAEVWRVLREVKEILAADGKAVELRERIKKIDDDAEDVVRQLKEFGAAHVLNFSDEESDPSIDSLTGLLDEKKSQHVEFEAASKQLKKIRKKRKEAQGAVDLATRTLSGLARDAGASSAGDLPDLIRRANEKRDYRSTLETLETDLLNEDCPIDETKARVTALADVDIEAEMGPLKGELEVAYSDVERTREEALGTHNAFEAMGGDSRAAECAAEAARVTSQIREDAEGYVRRVLASHLLTCAVERFRERNEAPMLRNASKYFSDITRGRYARVETDVDSKGQPFFLVRESSDSTSKTMDALSDGTRDQLHLALVLGSLEHRFSSGAEPIPLVLDDILVHFDDERSVAALEVLTDFSRTTQVLLFTHHTRIREQARSIGEANGAFVHDLAGGAH